MALSDEDVTTILRLIDEADVDELRVETPGFTLHMRRGSAPSDAATGAATGAVPITAPMLGVFYRAEGPAEAPFVEVGARVESGTVVGLIEVMKLMNAVQSEISGTVVEICAENGRLVEYGQPLVRVAPDR